MHLDSEDIVRRVLSSANCPIDFIVLFGSRVRGESGPKSDHDIAVSVPSLSKLREIATEGCPDWRVHRS